MIIPSFTEKYFSVCPFQPVSDFPSNNRIAFSVFGSLDTCDSDQSTDTDFSCAKVHVQKENNRTANKGFIVRMGITLAGKDGHYWGDNPKYTLDCTSLHPGSVVRRCIYNLLFSRRLRFYLVFFFSDAG